MSIIRCIIAFYIVSSVCPRNRTRQETGDPNPSVQCRRFEKQPPFELANNDESLSATWCYDNPRNPSKARFVLYKQNIPEEQLQELEKWAKEKIEKIDMINLEPPEFGEDKNRDLFEIFHRRFQAIMEDHKRLNPAFQHLEQDIAERETRKYTIVGRRNFAMQLRVISSFDVPQVFIDFYVAHMPGQHLLPKESKVLSLDNPHLLTKLILDDVLSWITFLEPYLKGPRESDLYTDSEALSGLEERK